VHATVIELPGPPAAVEVLRSVGPADEADEAARQADALRRQREAVQAEREGLAQASQALRHAAAAFAGLEAQVVREAEAQLVDLALAIARQVLAQEIENGRYKVEPIIQEALRQAPPRRDVLVHLNPQDLAHVQQAADAAPGPSHPGTDTGRAVVGVRFVANPNVRRAECLVETAEGTVPATIADRLEALGEALRQPE